MMILVVGATGATGRLLVQQLLDRGHEVRAIVRSAASLPESLQQHPALSLVQANLLDLSDVELRQQVSGCGALASCLGHNMSLRGIYGAPRRLVTEATHRLCDAIRASKPQGPVRFVLMNTTGNRNRDRDEPASLAQRAVIGLVRLLLPPHADNEQAAEHLRIRIGQHDETIQWVAVRPDTLIDEEEVTAYEVHPSPTRSPIFDAGKTSRINVAHFMAALITDDGTWSKWRGQMPVVYNQESG